MGKTAKELRQRRKAASVKECEALKELEHARRMLADAERSFYAAEEKYTKARSERENLSR